MTATVVHFKREPFDVYIGRPKKWGNPFNIGKDGTREEVIAKYAAWVIQQPELMAALPELKGKRLGCWCKPYACHGDILAGLVNALDPAPVDRSPKGHDPQGHGAKHESAATERSDGGRPTSTSSIEELRKALEDFDTDHFEELASDLHYGKLSPAAFWKACLGVAFDHLPALASQSPPPTERLVKPEEGGTGSGDWMPVKPAGIPAGGEPAPSCPRCGWNHTGPTCPGPQYPPPTDDVPAKSVEILRRALAWHGDWARMATTREDWQQEVDEALRWVLDNPEEGRPPRPALSAQLPPPIRGEGLVERLRKPLPICPFAKNAPPHDLEPEDPCPVCGGLGTEGADDKCRGADTRILDEAADEIERLTALATPSSPEGWVLPANRTCAVCTATVAESDEAMCCHCAEMPWKLAASPSSTLGDK